MGFNLGNYLNDNVFQNKDVKSVTNKIGDIGGSIYNKGSQLLGNYFNMLNSMTKRVGNFFGSTMMPYVLVIGAVIVIGYKFK